MEYVQHGQNEEGGGGGEGEEGGEVERGEGERWGQVEGGEGGEGKGAMERPRKRERVGESEWE